MPEFDAILIGTGQAAPALARRLTAAGMRVAIVERNKFGGTCVNTGCTPTKTLVASAYAAHLVHRAADYGILVEGEVRVDMKRVKARKDAVVGASSRSVERSLRDNPRCTVYLGHASFISSREVLVGADVLRAEKIFINVGGRASIPEVPGLNKVDYLTNSSILDLDYLPRRLIVIGGSYVGLELAQIYRRFGSSVVIVEQGSRLIPREDADVSAAIADFLSREGIEIHLNAGIVEVDEPGDEIALSLDIEGKTKHLVGTHLLLAVGRRPNTDDLGLRQAGITTDEHGYIQVDDRLQTNVAGIWALGDCNGRGAFTHTVYNDFEIVAANILDGERRGVHERIVAYSLYTDPPLGRAGMTEAQVRTSNKPALMATLSMQNVSRAIEKGETQGFMKILVDHATKQILGASILGVSGDEVIHCILDTMYAKAPYPVLQRAVHIHPTVSEFVPVLLANLKPLGERSV
jgi:pyruvate/2-oxoglutarate dehydrogenase complex dihydrolipoamide dehydrogenase (E3) component